jgi:hypothetical protein
MSTVSQEKVDALLKDMEANAPNVTIHYKTDKPPSLLIKLIYTLFDLIGKLSPTTKHRWYNNFANGFGNYILLPNRETFGDFTVRRNYAVLRHEYVHILDSKKYGLWFYLSYLLLPLPLLITCRAYWEFRGYAQNLIVTFEETGEIPDQHLQAYTTHFLSGMYLFMLPFKPFVLSRFEKLRELIYQGKVKGYCPNVSIYRPSIVPDGK